MESKFINFIRNNKRLVAFYLIWSFIHLILLINGRNHGGFYPFDGLRDIDEYGFIEFFVYETLPPLVFVLNKLIGEDVKKIIDEDK